MIIYIKFLKIFLIKVLTLAKKLLRLSPMLKKLTSILQIITNLSLLLFNATFCAENINQMIDNLPSSENQTAYSLLSDINKIGSKALGIKLDLTDIERHFGGSQFLASSEVTQKKIRETIDTKIIPRIEALKTSDTTKGDEIKRILSNKAREILFSLNKEEDFATREKDAIESLETILAASERNFSDDTNKKSPIQVVDSLYSLTNNLRYDTIEDLRNKSEGKSVEDIAKVNKILDLYQKSLDRISKITPDDFYKQMSGVLWYKKDLLQGFGRQMARLCICPFVPQFKDKIFDAYKSLILKLIDDGRISGYKNGLFYPAILNDYSNSKHNLSDLAPSYDGLYNSQNKDKSKLYLFKETSKDLQLYEVGENDWIYDLLNTKKIEELSNSCKDGSITKEVKFGNPFHWLFVTLNRTMEIERDRASSAKSIFSAIPSYLYYLSNSFIFGLLKIITLFDFPAYTRAL